MLNPKKHPLEIFRARRGHGPLVRRGASDAPDMPTDGGPKEEPPHPRWQPQPFEMRLSLLGTIGLALAWIFFLAAAYTLGVSRGREGSLADSDARAKEQGRLIEDGSSEDSSPPPPASSPPAAPAPTRPFGMIVLTYAKGTEDLPKRVGELKQTFEQRYQIAADQVTAWPLKSGETVVYVGVFDSREDAALQQLGAKLRQISDWPHGKDKSPFKDARISQHPNDPRKFVKSGGAEQDKN